MNCKSRARRHFSIAWKRRPVRAALRRSLGRDHSDILFPVRLHTALWVRAKWNTRPLSSLFRARSAKEQAVDSMKASAGLFQDQSAQVDLYWNASGAGQGRNERRRAGLVARAESRRETRLLQRSTLLDITTPSSRISTAAVVRFVFDALRNALDFDSDDCALRRDDGQSRSPRSATGDLGRAYVADGAWS